MRLFFAFTIIFCLIACQTSSPKDAAKEKSAKEECETVKKYEAGTLWVEKCLTEGGKTYFEYYESGQVRMTGLITKPDLRSGKWMSYFQDGTPWSEHHYVDGTKDGAYMVWWPNGNKRIKGQFVKGQETGSWVFYDESENIIKEESF